jgi:hypothetical protein
MGSDKLGVRILISGTDAPKKVWWLGLSLVVGGAAVLKIQYCNTRRRRYFRRPVESGVRPAAFWPIGPLPVAQDTWPATEAGILALSNMPWLSMRPC